MPAISVLLPVYNSEKYLDECLGSILAQTFRDFEIIAVNDCSIDGTQAKLNEYARVDPRVRVFQNPENLGIGESLNRAIDQAEGKYLARMDSDDISLPDRFEKQVQFLEKNIEVGVLGTSVQTFGDRDNVFRMSTNPKKVLAEFLFTVPVVHPSVMMRKACLEKYNIRYRADMVPAEDYDFWIRCAEHFVVTNLDEVLLKYNYREEGLESKYFQAQRNKSSKVRQRLLEKLMPSEVIDISVHEMVCSGSVDIEDLSAVDAWLLRMRKANKDRRVFPEEELDEAILQRWYTSVVSAYGKGLEFYNAFFQNKIFAASEVGLSWHLRALRRSFM